MIIYVDADACPVKDEIIKVASRYEIQVKLVSDGGLRPSRDPLVECVFVAQGADAADDWIVEQAEKHPRPLNHVKIYGDGNTSWGSGLPPDGVERFWRDILGGSALRGRH